MKRNYYLFILLLVIGAISSCKKSDIEHTNDYDKSYKAWQAFKTSSNNSYRYRIYSGSWTGQSSETTITVKEGKVIGRSYVAKSIEGPPHQVVVREEWVEDADDLNSHPNGYNTITLDDIYHKAKTEWLIKRKDAEVYFETKNNGMISSCGFVPNGCADDCFRGISINLIEAL